MIEIGGDSFHEYQQGQLDDLWDEYLDYVGLAGRAVNMDSLEDFLFVRGVDISDRAATVMYRYVREQEI
jgi:hypothetical protein